MEDTSLKLQSIELILLKLKCNHDTKILCHMMYGSNIQLAQFLASIVRAELVQELLAAVHAVLPLCGISHSLVTTLNT